MNRLVMIVAEVADLRPHPKNVVINIDNVSQNDIKFDREDFLKADLVAYKEYDKEKGMLYKIIKQRHTTELPEGHLTVLQFFQLISNLVYFWF